MVLMYECFVLGFGLTHVDEVIDELLTKDYSCDIALPRIKKRYSLILIGFFFSVLWCVVVRFC